MDLKAGHTEDCQGLPLHEEGKWWRILSWWLECRIILSWERRRSRWAGHRQFLQVVHEDLKADVISENRSPCLLLQQKGKTTVKRKNKSNYPVSNSKTFLYDITDLTITLITFLSPRWSHISSEVPFQPLKLTTCCRIQFKALRSIRKNGLMLFLAF